MKLKKRDFIPIYGNITYFSRFFKLEKPNKEDLTQALSIHYYHLYTGLAVIMGIIYGAIKLIELI